jgi:hypothetical protein
LYNPPDREGMVSIKKKDVLKKSEQGTYKVQRLPFGGL